VRVLAEREAFVLLEFRMSMTRLVKIEKVQARGGEIENPVVAEARFDAAVSIPEATPVVLGVLPSFHGPLAGQDSVVIVGKFRRFIPE
jgi:hypothetical protein